MLDERNTLNITGGMDVFGSDGDKVGSVSGVEGDYVIVSKGFFFPTDYYIPVSAINTANEDGVYLNVSKDDALHQGWDSIPAAGTSTVEGAYTDQELTDRATRDSYATDQSLTGQGSVDTAATGYDTTGTGATGYATDHGESLVDKVKDTLTGDDSDQPFDHHTDAGQIHRDDSETIRVPLAEEELTARKRDIDRGAVHVDKVVTEEQQTLDVPVSEDRVNVSRRAVDRDIDPGETSFDEGTIEVPLHGEEVEVDKRARVREELEISKDRVQNTQQVTDTVRREEARIREGENVIENAGTAATNGKSRNRGKAKNK
jgi:uncharacterized protein (TIGR02271 family)